MNPDEIIQATLDNPNYVNLKKKEITLPGTGNMPARKMVLIETCNALRFRQGVIVNQIQMDTSLSDDEKTFLLTTYVQIAPFSFGDVPTYQEYSFAMTDEQTVLWLEAMHDINPENVKIFFPEAEITRDAQDAKKARAKKK